MTKGHTYLRLATHQQPTELSEYSDAPKANSTHSKKKSVERYVLPIYFSVLALLNLFVLIQANQLAFSQPHQPYDFYVLLRASSLVFTNPSQIYIYQLSGSLGPYWSAWLGNGYYYQYSPMFAVLLSPLSSLNPPTAKIIWEGLSYSLLVISCALTTKSIPSKNLKFLFPFMIFIMPLQIIYTDQSLPQLFGAYLPQMAGMWISLVYFTDYYWGNSNAMILALGLLSFYFTRGSGTVSLGRVRIPSYALGSLFLALDTFKVTAGLLILPFWLALNIRHLRGSLGYLILFIVILNSVVLFEPTLSQGYYVTLIQESLNPGNSALWEVYDYVWYYTLPIVGLATLFSRRGRGHGSNL